MQPLAEMHSKKSVVLCTTSTLHNLDSISNVCIHFRFKTGGLKASKYL